ncbi:MAG: phage major capsid protein [Xanthomonadales bacterium]|nr:phage major capsid protein [Xanthomonadales bacterium]
MSNSNVARGIVVVRADSAAPDVKAVVENLNKAFAAFKDQNDTRLTAVEAAVDDVNLKIVADQMTGKPNATTAAPADGVRVLRNYGEFRAHYGKGSDAHDVNNPVPLAEFMRGVAGMKTSDLAIKALSEGTDSAGGYAVPNIVMPRILDAMVPASSLLQAGAGFVPLDEGAKTATTAVTDTLPVAAWRNELGSITESDPTFRSVVATPRSLACIVRISRELLADGVDIDRAIRTAIGQAFAKEIDRVGLRGSGTAPEPRGLLNTTGVNAVSLGTNGAALASYAPILSGIQSILDADGPMPTAAIMAPRSLVDFGGLVDTTDQPLRAPSLVEPVRFIGTSQIPVNLTVGTSTDCSEVYLGDFSRMYFLLRENLSVQLLREAYAKTGELGFLCHLRADVVVPYPAAFAIVKGVRKAA